MNTDLIWNELTKTGRAAVVGNTFRSQLLDEAREEGVRLEFRDRVTGGTVIYLRRQAYFTGQYIT